MVSIPLGAELKVEIYASYGCAAISTNKLYFKGLLCLFSLVHSKTIAREHLNMMLNSQHASAIRPCSHAVYNLSSPTITQDIPT